MRFCHKEAHIVDVGKWKVIAFTIEPRHEITCLWDFRPGLTQQPNNVVRGLKIWINIENGFYYLCSENKDTDQLRCDYLAADVRLCLRKCKKAGFLMTRLKCCTITVLALTSMWQLQILSQLSGRED